MSRNNLFEELKRRNVYKVAVAYVVVSWLLIQAASILLPAGRPRSAAMLTALVLFPLLILGDQWHANQIVELRHHQAKAAVAIIVGGVLVFALAWVFVRWPALMPLAIIAAVLV